MTDFHLFSFAGDDDAMRAAFPHGQVFFAMDDYSLGPLDDGRKRYAFWRDMADGGDQALQETSVDCFAPWRQLQSTLAQTPACRVYVWHGASGAESLFLRMACHWLADTVHSMHEVKVPARDGIFATAAWPPGQLANLLVNATLLSSGQREALAKEFSAIAARPEMLRECDETGGLRLREMDVHDDFLLDCCPLHWEIAARVVGEAMGRADQRNGQGDIFWGARLRWLIDAGLVEAEGDCGGLREYRVRRRGGIPRA